MNHINTLLIPGKPERKNRSFQPNISRHFQIQQILKTIQIFTCISLSCLHFLSNQIESKNERRDFYFYLFFSVSEVPIGDRSRQIWRRETHQEPSSAAPVDQSAPSRQPEDFALRPAAAVPSPFLDPAKGNFVLNSNLSASSSPAFSQKKRRAVSFTKLP